MRLDRQLQPLSIISSSAYLCVWPRWGRRVDRTRDTDLDNRCCLLWASLGSEPLIALTMKYTQPVAPIRARHCAKYANRAVLKLVCLFHCLTSS